MNKLITAFESGNLEEARGIQVQFITIAIIVVVGGFFQSGLVINIFLWFSQLV